MGKSPPRWKNLLEDENEINDDIFFLFSGLFYDDDKIGEKCLTIFQIELSEELYNLLGSEFFSADWAELVWKRSQALEASAMAAVKDAFFSLVVVVFFQADLALAAIVFTLI